MPATTGPHVCAPEPVCHTFEKYYFACAPGPECHTIEKYSVARAPWPAGHTYEKYAWACAPGPGRYVIQATNIIVPGPTLLLLGQIRNLQVAPVGGLDEFYLQVHALSWSESDSVKGSVRLLPGTTAHTADQPALFRRPSSMSPPPALCSRLGRSKRIVFFVYPLPAGTFAFPMLVEVGSGAGGALR